MTPVPDDAADAGLARSASLPERVQRGEALAEAELAARFRPGLVALLRFRTRDPEVAQELAHDTLIAVLQALRAGKLREPEHLAAFVHGIARNLMNSHFRRRSAGPRLEPLEAHAERLQAADLRASEDRQAQVRRALDQLETQDRQVLALTLVEGLKPGEIAARLGLSPEVTRMRKSRALRRLIERLRT